MQVQQPHKKRSHSLRLCAWLHMRCWHALAPAVEVRRSKAAPTTAPVACGQSYCLQSLAILACQTACYMLPCDLAVQNLQLALHAIGFPPHPVSHHYHDYHHCHYLCRLYVRMIDLCAVKIDLDQVVDPAPVGLPDPRQCSLNPAMRIVRVTWSHLLG